ncbi:hypothetical protein [Adlercreutzia caecimuris]|uniref:hypothetical protein n=1 Tax=Adlercreutzia caecimuris TaxID=671266 RepID=UPI00272D11DE|nr:hypothetical protein [Adlercreutzia caecimuris]
MTKEGWSGPLAEATDGMSVGVILDGIGYKSMQGLDNLMSDPGKQGRVPLNRLRGLAKAAPEENRRKIVGFMVGGL